jgi:chemotaxis protein methyltransferase CheR
MAAEASPSKMLKVAQEAADYDFVIALVYERSRIRLHEGKHALIRARLGKRMRARGFVSFHDYCDFLRHEADEDELTHVVDALATNFTSFLREKDHFEFMVDHALPGLLAPGEKQIRVWSAACATGEEPYTIALYLAEKFPAEEGWGWEIAATDVSTKALAAAQAGVYSAEKVAAVPPDWMRRHFQRGRGDWEGYYRVKELLRRRVSFRRVNLLDDYHFDRVFDVIFCRNVMIYFDRPTQQELVARLLRFLRPGGYLLTGHAESLNGLGAALRPLRPSIYQKE